MSTSLDEDVRAALQARRGDWRSIALRSGVSYSWIGKFVNRRIPNPGFVTLKTLHETLLPAGGTPAPAPAQQAA